MTSKKTCKLSTVQQLIDLNGDNVNFKLQAKIIPANNDVEYEICVLTQEDLDSGQPIQFRKSRGPDGVEMLWERNEYHNFFLLLKSEKELDVEVVTELQALPYNKSMNEQELSSSPSTLQPQKQKGSKLFLVLGILGVLVAIGGIVFFLLKGKKKGSGESLPEIKKEESEKPVNTAVDVSNFIKRDDSKRSVRLREPALEERRSVRPKEFSETSRPSILKEQSSLPKNRESTLPRPSFSRFESSTKSNTLNSKPSL